MREQIKRNTEKLQRVIEDVEVPPLPEARRLWTKERPVGVQIIKTHVREFAQRMHMDGQSYRQWIQAGKQTLSQLARKKKLETLELVHMMAWTWSPVVITRTHQLDLEVEKALLGILEQVTLAEIVALFVAFRQEEFVAGPVRLFDLLLGSKTETDSFLTFRAICSNQYPAIQEMIKLCSKPEDRRKIEEAKSSREDSFNQWVFYTLIRISEIFEEGRATHPGFFFPSFLATLMNLEVPELLACVGETLIPIFGGSDGLPIPRFSCGLSSPRWQDQSPHRNSRRTGYVIG